MAVAFYAIAAALMCSSWLLFFRHVSRRDHLLHKNVDSAYFRYERLRAGVGVVLYLGSAIAGWLITPVLALPVFASLPIFFWSTTEASPTSPRVCAGRAGGAEFPCQSAHRSVSTGAVRCVPAATSRATSSSVRS